MNTATLAVAGSRKTQSIVDACANGPAGRRRLVLTYEGDPFGGPGAMRLSVGGSWPTVGQTRRG